MSGTMSTYGWDTVFAIRVSDANEALAASGAYPTSFANPNDDIDVSGTFATWAITRGGGGTNIRLAVPIATGTLAESGQTASMDGALAVLSVALNLLPQPGATCSAGLNNLVLDATPPAPDQPAVAVTSLTFPKGSDPGPAARALMIGGLSDWFNANLDLITHVFATVDLNSSVDQGPFNWLGPTYSGYAYVDGPDDDTSYLGLLSAVVKDPAGGLTGELSPNAIPAGSRAGFTISCSAFLRELLLPSLPGAFPGSTTSNFALSPDGSTLVNTGTIATRSVENEGITYYPEVQQLSVSVVGVQLLVFMETSTEISPGVYAWVRSTSYLSLQLDTSTGQQKLTWVQAQDPLTENWTAVSEGVQITEVIVEIIAVVAIVILGVLTDGAAFVVAAIIVGLVCGFAAATPELVAAVAGKSVGSEVPSISALVMNATAPIMWPGGGTFALTWAGLNGDFQLGGDPFNL